MPHSWHITTIITHSDATAEIVTAGGWSGVLSRGVCAEDRTIMQSMQDRHVTSRNLAVSLYVPPAVNFYLSKI